MQNRGEPLRYTDDAIFEIAMSLGYKRRQESNMPNALEFIIDNASPDPRSECTEVIRWVAFDTTDTRLVGLADLRMKANQALNDIQNTQSKMALDSRTSPEYLDALVRMDDSDLDFAVAQNSNALPATLRQIYFQTREIPTLAELASNPNTPEDVLCGLADFIDIPVRLNLTLNPNTPVDVLRRLSWSDDLDVRSEALIELAARQSEPLGIRKIAKQVADNLSRSLEMARMNFPKLS